MLRRFTSRCSFSMKNCQIVKFTIPRELHRFSIVKRHTEIKRTTFDSQCLNFRCIKAIAQPQLPLTGTID
jgi:hypothetical protein